MGEIPQHWHDVIHQKPSAIDDGSFFWSLPEPLGRSGYAFRFIIETVDGAHGLPAGVYVETTIPYDDFIADQLNLHTLVGSEVCTQLMKDFTKDTLQTDSGHLISLNNAINTVFEGTRTTDGRVVFHILPIDREVAAREMRSVVEGRKTGYVMR